MRHQYIYVATVLFGVLVFLPPSALAKGQKVIFHQDMAGKSFRYKDIRDGKWRLVTYSRNNIIKVFEGRKLYVRGRWWLRADRICAAYPRSATVCGIYRKTGSGRIRTPKGYLLIPIDS